MSSLSQQENPFEFWNRYPSLQGYEIVANLLGNQLRYNHSTQFAGQNVIEIGHRPDFDLSTVECEMRRNLDAIEWQFVTTGRELELKNGERVKAFAITP